MAWYRTGVPRRLAAAASSAGTDGSSYYTPIDPLGNLEQSSLYTATHKEINTKFAGQKYNAVTGAVVKRWGGQDGQQFEQASKDQEGSAERAAKIIYDSTAGTSGTEGTEGDGTEPLEDWECCAWLQISAPNSVESGSTSGVSAGNKKGCVYYWEVLGCTPEYWGCGTLTAAGTGGGSGAGLHYTADGMVFIAPTIPDKETTNCNRTVDTKIRVSVLTADGKKQVAAEYGSAGWSGYGMGPGDELYEEFGPSRECEDTANITTTAEDCPDKCLGSEIGFATQNMPAGSFQNLAVVGGSPSEDYEWSLQGGGSISMTKGVSTVYYSPSSNFNCEENAIITLKCNGVVVDTLGIAVYGAAANYVLGYTLFVTGLMHPECRRFEEGCGGSLDFAGKLWSVQDTRLFCDGSTDTSGLFGNTFCMGICFPHTGVYCWTNAMYCADMSAGCPEGAGPCSFRPVANYAELIAGGCCPFPPA